MIEVTIILFIYLFAKLALDTLQIYTIKHSKIDAKSMQLIDINAVSYTHLLDHETPEHII